MQTDYIIGGLNHVVVDTPFSDRIYGGTHF